MTQAGFFALVYAAGLAFNLATGPHRDAPLSCALAFPCGLTLWVLGALAGVATGLGSATASGTGALLAIGVVSGGAAIRRRRTPGSWVQLLAGTCLFVAASAILCSFSLAKASPDSLQYTRMATVFARGGGLDETAAFFLADRGVFTFLAHAASKLAGVDYMDALPSVTAMAFIALFAVVTVRALTSEGVGARVAAIAATGVTAAVMSTYIVAYHMFYIHSNFGSALFLFGFAALFWLAERRDDPSTLVAAFVCLVAFTLERVEAPLFTALFAALAVWPSRLPRRLLAAGLAATGAITAAWLLRLAATIPADSDFLTPWRALALSLLVLAPLAGLPLVRHLPRRALAQHLPHALLAVTVAGVGLAFVLKPDHMAESVAALATNLLGIRTALWGYVWWVALALAALSLATPPLRVGRPLLVGVAVALLTVILLSFFRPPYRVGLADSASRMSIHFVPLLYFLYAVKFVPLLARPTTAEVAG
ncbi:MAG TPA: hypothetical protein VK698_21095 [Kofleriaceae bacterium]|nr:hypothetical protein [Kofleriaceae bacterium]